MTIPMRARRMRLLIASFAAILGLVAVLQWTVTRLDAVATRNKVGRKPAGWVILNGVEYRPILEVSPPDRDSRRAHRASVEACDPVGGGRLWKVTVREAAWPESGGGMLEPPWLSQAQFLAQFALKLAVQGRAISVPSADGGSYLVDPETRQVRQLKAPTPPKRPILDARLRARTRCEIHDRPLLEDVVPIRYGFAVGVGNTDEYEARRTRFPNANSSVGGGCVIEASREARVLFCPDCRGSEREWASSPAVERSDDEDGQGRVN